MASQSFCFVFTIMLYYVSIYEERLLFPVLFPVLLFSVKCHINYKYGFTKICFQQYVENAPQNAVLIIGSPFQVAIELDTMGSKKGCQVQLEKGEKNWETNNLDCLSKRPQGTWGWSKRGITSLTQSNRNNVRTSAAFKVARIVCSFTAT